MKKRLDILVFEKGLAKSRMWAQSLIMEGRVFVEGQRADKPGMPYPEECKIEVKKKEVDFVSRGGLKLFKAINVFNINLKNLVALDAGASTGGFTDCMLQNGCKKVYAIDVGYGQLDWKLRNDKRVINLERTNIRYITKDKIDDEINFFSADLSFISLCTVLPAIRQVISKECRGVCLIKPQFEAGKEKVGKKGVIRDRNVRIETIQKVINFCENNGFSVNGLDFSPVKGPKGNIEYLLYIQKSDDAKVSKNINVDLVESMSFKELSGEEQNF